MDEKRAALEEIIGDAVEVGRYIMHARMGYAGASGAKAAAIKRAVERIVALYGWPPPTGRNAEIAQAVMGGEPIAEVARRYGISRGRVYQIVKASKSDA